MLTAIVIGFALQAFLLALAWRSWTLDGHDDVEDDIEDRRLAAERRRQIRMDEAERVAPSASASSAATTARRSRRSAVGNAGRAGVMDRLAPLPTVIPLDRRGAGDARGRWTACASGSSPSPRCPPRSAMSIALLVDVDRNGPAVARIGGWSPLIGITYVIDRSRAIMLVIGMLTLLVVLVFAIGERSPTTSIADVRPGVPGARRRRRRGVLHRRPVPPVRLVRDPADGQLRAADPRRRRGAGARRHHLRRDQHDRVRRARRRRRAGLRLDRLAEHGRAARTASPGSTTGCAPGCSCCCSSPSASRPRCSRCSSGCPTRTRRPAARSPRCSPACSPRSACTR